MTKDEAFKLAMQACKETWNEKTCAEIIKALEPQPCEDCVSRHYIEGIVEELENICYNAPQEVLELLSSIKNAPPVTPQPEIVRCSQCKYAEVADLEDSQDGYTCQFHRGSIWFSGSYCSWAERRQDG